MNRADLRAALANQNVAAFMAVIDLGEHGPNADAPERYRTMFGGGLFDAPPWEHPRRPVTVAGLTSTAAGRGQFLAKTWDGLVRLYGFEDFSPGCQNEAIVALISGRRALSDVIEGRFEDAIAKCNREWASLPGSPYGQPTLTMDKARERYLERGGYLSAAPATDPDAWQKHEHYGDRVTESTTRPTPSADEQEANMAPILAAILPGLFKAAPDLIRLIGNGERSDRNAAIVEKVAEVAVQVTGAQNEQEAARRIETNPEAAKAFRAAVAENFDQWMGMAVKFRELDEASRGKAREFVTAYGRAPVAGAFTFVELLSLVFVIVAAVGGGFVLWDPLEKFTTEMQTAVVMLMLIGGWNGVKEFWLGSSMGSMRKDERPTTTTAKE